MSDLKITGNLIARLKAEIGTSKSGNDWKKQTFVIQTIDQYPKTIAFDVFGKYLDSMPKLKKDDLITVYLDINSREYNGKYYSNINAWKIELLKNKSSQPTIKETPPPPPEPTTEEDLPF